MRTATARAPAARKAAAKKVDIQKLTPKQLDALPEDVFMASLKPHVRKFAEGLFKLKGIR